MRYFKTLALVTALMVGGGAFADDSTNTDHNNASMELTTSGTPLDAVKFTIAQTTLTIPAAQVRPGATFTVTVPVSNPTTNRKINVSGVESKKTGDLASKLTVTPVAASNVPITAGGKGDLTFTFKFADAVPGEAVYTGDVSVTFTVTATADDGPEKDLTFGK
ncbi:hypothetical protein [Deinococcus phoenicis]|uniref:hypothetical protein n=1 Tax=Deinococcus phoenicis TaxID=1476583 RepID=UPI00068782E1|nr:hypothetical protein [Deinococcus phoenicis]